MILVRGIKFVKSENKLYIIGSASNETFCYLTIAMGQITILAWIDEDSSKYDLSKMEILDESLPITVIPHKKVGLYKRLKIIYQTIKEGDCFNFKLALPDSIIGCFFAILLRKPYVIESGSDMKTSLWYHGGLLYKIAAYPFNFIIYLEHRFASHIIYVSKRFLQEKYPSKARQIGISDTILTTPPETILEKRILRIQNSKKDFVLGLIGATHVEYRGHDTLIKAAAKLVEKGYNIKVRFLGGGTGDNKRIALAHSLGVENIIEFSGRKKHEDVLTWIDDIDVLVMPTLQETLGRAIIEAMSRGCPIVGSIETAIGEQIGSDCLVHARNVDEIVDTVERIISNKNYAIACAKENYYRSFKYNSDYTFSLRKEFYDKFYEIEGIAKQ